MEFLRVIRAKCRVFCTRTINTLWRDDPNGDCFWLLNYFLILGGTRFKPKTRLQKICWFLYHILALFQFCIQIMNVITFVTDWQENTSTIWSMLSLLAMTMCWVKQLILWNHRKSIDECNDLINERCYSSGDPCFDAESRKQFYRTSQQMICCMFVTVFLDDIFIGTPNPLRDRLFGIPHWLFDFNPLAAHVIQFFFCWFFAFVWVSKLFCSSATAASTLIGLRAELQIVAHNYGLIMDRLKEEISADTEFYECYIDTQHVREQFWKDLKLHIETVSKQHCLILENIQSLKVTFESIFFIIYYQTLIVLGSVFYVVLSERLSICSIAIGFCVTITALECYWWCYLVDSFIKINESIVKHVLCLATEIPHSKDQHSAYVEMRTSLMLIGINARSSVRFNCVGVFPISTAVFADLVNISYSVLTFLLNTM